LSIESTDIFKNDKFLASKITYIASKISPKKVGKYFGKYCFLAIFAKCGTIWQEATLLSPAEAGCETWSGFFCH